MNIDKEKFMSQPPDPEREERQRLARRDDLATVLGVVLTVPIHGQDEFGNWRYGLSPYSGIPSPDIMEEFEAEMRSIIVESASPLVEAGILTEQQVNGIKSHGYETGPAAQGWPQLFFEIYQQVGPVIAGSADLIAVADFIKQVATGVRNWQQRKREEIEREHGDTLDRTVPIDLDPQVVLTLPNLVALCYTDLIQRHRESHEVAITVFPRNRWAGYGSANHPSGGETYVIRLAAGERHFFYLVDGHGRVSEHYRTSGDNLELLALPDLLPDDMSGNAYRQPEQPRQFEVRRSAIRSANQEDGTVSQQLQRNDGFE